MSVWPCMLREEYQCVQCRSFIHGAKARGIPPAVVRKEWLTTGDRTFPPEFLLDNHNFTDHSPAISAVPSKVCKV